MPLAPLSFNTIKSWYVFVTFQMRLFETHSDINNLPRYKNVPILSCDFVKWLILLKIVGVNMVGTKGFEPYRPP